jgi:hypothetical protein
MDARGMDGLETIDAHGEQWNSVPAETVESRLTCCSERVCVERGKNQKTKKRGNSDGAMSCSGSYIFADLQNESKGTNTQVF